MKKRTFVLVALIVLVGAIAFLLSRQTIRRQLPPSFIGLINPSPEALPSFSYKDLLPGSTNKPQIINSLGQPIREELDGTETTLVYPSGVGVRPLLVAIDRAGIVKLIKEPLSENTPFSAVSMGLGTHDQTLYGSYYPLGYELRIYRSSGIALLVNPEQNTVRERWYFPANTESAVFQKSFAPEFSTTPPPLDQE